MPPHAHGGGDEEEEIIVRTDGPPFADIKAKHVSYYYSFSIIVTFSSSSLTLATHSLFIKQNV